ncbi:MAG: hypothetical protein ACYCPV_05230, partial [Thermoplasmata archaeon]
MAPDPPPPARSLPSASAATRRSGVGPTAAGLVVVAFLVVLGFAVEDGSAIRRLEATASEIARFLGTGGLLVVGLLGILAVGLAVAAARASRLPP